MTQIRKEHFPSLTVLHCPRCGSPWGASPVASKPTTHCPACLQGALQASQEAILGFLGPSLDLPGLLKDDGLLEAAAAVSEEDPSLAAIFQACHRSHSLLEA